MKSKAIFLIVIIALLSLTLAACTQLEESSQINPDSQIDDARKPMEKPNKNDNISKIDPPTPRDDLKENENTTETTKIEGRRKEFIEKLDNIQKELDAMPVKKDSDAGLTSAMRNYYGLSYEKYDEALNEIYALLKEELSQETMDDLKSKQLKWIELKEAAAREAEAEFEGGTFQFVAGYISLYNSTKEKCYELVNEYLTD